MTYGIVEIG